MWHIGQRVVCVDDSGIDSRVLNKPIKNKIYTIRTVDDNGFNKLGLRLVEIKNNAGLVVSPKNGIHIDEVCFKESRFKPIDEKRIDIFRAMLVTKKETEKV